jgi:hypothetical protein
MAAQAAEKVRAEADVELKLRDEIYWLMGRAKIRAKSAQGATGQVLRFE